MVHTPPTVPTSCPVGTLTLSSVGTFHSWPESFVWKCRRGQPLGATLKQWVTGDGEKCPEFLALGRRGNSSEFCFLLSPRGPGRTEPQLPIVVTCSLRHRGLSLFHTPLPGLPGISSQTNYLHSNPCFQVGFWALKTHSCISVHFCRCHRQAPNLIPLSTLHLVPAKCFIYITSLFPFYKLGK